MFNKNTTPVRKYIAFEFLINFNRTMKKLFSKPFKIFLLLVTLLATAEISYINQWINPHSGTFEKLNPESEIAPGGKRKTILVLGDEISANPQSYVAMLRKNHPDYRIINGSVPNTGAIEASFIGEKLIKEYDPDILVYQMNPANDLYDLRKGQDLSEANLVGSVTNLLTDKVRILNYIFYTLSRTATEMGGNAFAALEPQNLIQNQNISFKPLTGKSFEKQNGLVENSTLLKSGRNIDFEEALTRLNTLFCWLKKGATVLFLITPHCSWIDKYYVDNMLKAGNFVSNDFANYSGTYPIIKKIKEYSFSLQKVKIVDPTLMLRFYDIPEKRLFNISSSDMNKYGHEVLASTLSGYIRQTF